MRKGILIGTIVLLFIGICAFIARRQRGQHDNSVAKNRDISQTSPQRFSAAVTEVIRDDESLNENPTISETEIVNNHKITVHDPDPNLIQDESGNLILERKIIHGEAVEMRRTYAEDGTLLFEESSNDAKRTVHLGQEDSRILN